MPITKHEALLREARTRFETLAGAQSHILEAAREDMRFVYNLDEGQWPASIRAERERDGRPCLTSNKLRKFVSVVANQLIQSRPAIGVIAVDDVSDPATAKIREDYIRHVEYASMAPAIYQQTLEHAVAIGFGYWRILTEYAKDSFDQDIVLRAVDDPFSAYLDPDGQFGFVHVAMSKAQFEAKYPTATFPDSPALAGITQSGYWLTNDRAYVAEYFWKEPVTTTLLLVQERAGQVQTIKLPKDLRPEELVAQGYQVLRERKQTDYAVKWVTMSAIEVLGDEQDWPGCDIPIIEVCGDKQHFEGQWYKRSLIRDAKDPMRMYNYWLTAQTEAIALVPKAPFLVTPEMIRGHETMWNEANTKNRPYLYFNQSGQKVPTRERPPEVQQGAMAMMKIADQDIKDVIGIFEPGLGDVSNERSGRAIKMRQDRSDLGTGHFQEQFKHALIRTGKQLIDLIPKVIDTERLLRLQGEDGVSRLVPVNQTVIDLDTGQPRIINDLSVGRFDVQATIRVYQTRREEAAEMMVQALQYAGPVIAPYLLPLVFKYSDWPGAEEVQAIVQQVLQGQQAPAAPGAAQPSSMPAPASPGGNPNG